MTIQLEGKSHLPKGRISTIVGEAKQKLKFRMSKFPYPPSRDKFSKESQLCFGGSVLKLPMVKVVDHILSILVQIGKIRHPLTCTNILLLTYSWIEIIEVGKEVKYGRQSTFESIILERKKWRQERRIMMAERKTTKTYSHICLPKSNLVLVPDRNFWIRTIILWL